MAQPPYDDLAAQFEQALATPASARYTLRLYVAGASKRSLRAIENVRRLCERYMPGRYELEIIDIYQKPVLAQNGDIQAAPTLVKQLPLPLRRLIGDLSDEERVLKALDIRSSGSTGEGPHD